MLRFSLILILLPLVITSYAQNYKLETVVQKGHFSSVQSVAVDSRGALLASGSRDKTAKIWDVATGKEIRTFIGHESTVNGVSFSRDSKFLLTSSDDGSAKIWEVNTGKVIFTTPKDEKKVTAAVFSPDEKFVVTAGYSYELRIWNIKDGTLYRKLQVDSDMGSGYGISLNFSGDGRYLVVGEDNKSASVYDASSFELLYKIKPEKGWCGGCGTYTGTSSAYIFRQSHNDPLYVHDIKTGKPVLSFSEVFDRLSGVQVSEDEKTVLAGDDKHVYIYDITSGNLRKKLVVSEGPRINRIVLGSDNRTVFAASDDNIITQWDIESGKQMMVFSGLIQSDTSRNLGYDPNNYWESFISKCLRLKNPVLLLADGKKLIKGKTGNDVKIWDIPTGSPKDVFSGHKKPVVALELSADGTRLVTGDVGGTVAIWDIENQKKLAELSGHREPVFQVRLSPDEKILATSAWDATLLLWDTETGVKRSTIDLDKSSAFTFSFTPDGLYLVVAKMGVPSLDLIEPDSKKIVRTFIGHTDVVSSISFHPSDPQLMLTSSWDGSVRLWDLTTGLMKGKLTGNAGAVQSAIFTPEGQYVVTAGSDGIIRVWDWKSSKIMRQLEGHKSEVSNLFIEKNGEMLVSVSVDGAIKFWNFATGEESFEHIHLPGRDWMAVTKEGYFNGTAESMKYIHFVKGTEVIGTEQLIEKFHKPDLLPSLFRKRGETGYFKSVDDLLESAPLPTVKVSAILNEDTPEAEIFIKIIENGGGVDEVKLMHNGKRIPVRASGILHLKKGESKVIKEIVSLVHGVNSFEVSAFNKERIESAPVMTEVFSDKGELGSTCYIVAIGIDKYSNPSLVLNYARADAEGFSSLLENKGSKMFKKVVVHSLYDEDATRDNILDTLSMLSGIIQKNDVFIFYYAGHGVLSADKFYFVSSNCVRLYDNNKLVKDAIEASDIQEKFSNIKALKQLIIMDACHSGGSVLLLGERGGIEEKAMAQLARSAGIHVLASAGSNQAAKEVHELGHGMFTYLIIKALEGDADGAPKDGKITVYELKSYLDDQTPVLNRKFTGKPQHPYTFSQGHDFPLVVD